MNRSLEVFRVRLVRISEESRRDKNLQGIVIQADAIGATGDATGLG
jgi:hypothetical protein